MRNEQEEARRNQLQRRDIQQSHFFVGPSSEKVEVQRVSSSSLAATPSVDTNGLNLTHTCDMQRKGQIVPEQACLRMPRTTAASTSAGGASFASSFTTGIRTTQPTACVVLSPTTDRYQRRQVAPRTVTRLCLLSNEGFDEELSTSLKMATSTVDVTCYPNCTEAR